MMVMCNSSVFCTMTCIWCICSHSPMHSSGVITWYCSPLVHSGGGKWVFCDHSSFLHKTVLYNMSLASSHGAAPSLCTELRSLLHWLPLSPSLMINRYSSPSSHSPWMQLDSFQWILQSRCYCTPNTGCTSCIEVSTIIWPHKI